MPQSPAKPFSGIFVSYRRDDSSGHAGRLFDKLVAHFGRERIFMDIDTIEPGEDFVAVIENAVGSCDILIAMIGRNWLAGTGGATGRLDNPNDWVRLEIATALRRDIRVIPVLVQRATMPKPQDLPDDLAKFTRRSAIELSDVHWQNDVDQLIGVMEKVLVQRGEVVRPPVIPITPTPTPNRTKLLVIIASVVILTILAIAVVIWMKVLPPGDQQTANRNASPQPTVQTTRTPPPTPIHPPSGMVYVPGGEFMMGRNKGEGGDEYENPAHKVAVKPFFIDTHEVTCEEFGRYLQDHSVIGGESSQCAGREGLEPVTGVTWDDAKAYATWAGKRLPTEEEWEFAARGTDGRRYPWGNEWLHGHANANGANKTLARVGEFGGASPFGAVDMVGNAWEWTASDFRAYPGGNLTANQSSGELRVIRGGSYESTKDYATTTYRTGWLTRGAKTYDQTGFRCGKDIAP